MLSTLRRLFHRPPPPRVLFEHPNLGMLRFDPAGRSWESTSDMEVYFGGIPGDASGPAQAACDELLSRMHTIDRYWEACDGELRFLLEGVQVQGEPRDVLRVSAMSLYEDCWEVCFETRAEHRWLYVGMQFQGDELVSNTIDT